MATTGGSSPMQDFIRNMMEVKQYQLQQNAQLQQAEQFGQQQALALRQQDNQELGAFAQMAKLVKDPNELGSLGEYFAQKAGDPARAELFRSIAANTATAMQTQLEAAGMRAGNASADRALAISRDLELGATGQQRGEQFATELDFRNTVQKAAEEQFRLSHNQRAQQFSSQMGFNYSQLGQQYELGMLNLQSPVERFMTNRGTLSAEANKLRQQLNGPISQDARAAIERQIKDIETQQTQLDALLASEMASRAGSGGPGGMDLNQLFTAEATAWQDINEAKGRGNTEAAIDRYNRLRAWMPVPGLELQYRDTWKPRDAGAHVVRPDTTRSR